MNIDDLNRAFEISCIHGNLDTAKILYSKGIDINHSYTLFITACMYDSNIEIIKWLHSIGYELNIKKDLAFSSACKNGCLTIAKYLYEIGANIRYCNDIIFKECCITNNITIAQWLSSLEHHYTIQIINGVVQIYNTTTNDYLIENIFNIFNEYKNMSINNIYDKLHITDSCELNQNSENKCLICYEENEMI